MTTRRLPITFDDAFDEGAGAERRTRSDALPEHIEYRDEGCDLFASCLRCPLMRCRYDVPGGVRTLLNRERDHQIRMLRDESALTVEAIAERFRVSRRTVFRALQPRRQGCDESESHAELEGDAR